MGESSVIFKITERLSPTDPTASMRPIMETTQEIPEMISKTILAAALCRAEDDDADFVLRLADRMTLVVGAWQQEGRPVEMAARIKP